MRFLVNENFPLESVHNLQEPGHDAGAIIEDSPSAEDRDVLTRAAREQRIILTLAAAFLDKEVQPVARAGLDRSELVESELMHMGGKHA
jgi:predicted nuclease of predicted toxin-antitoxin system